MSGLGDKLGNVYELEYVRVLWLRLLLGDIEEVAWEPPGRESDGTEGYFVEGGTKWYFQCKSRQRPTLSLKEVAETLTPMWQHLQGAPSHATLLQVSDARCEALELLLHWANFGPPDGPPPDKANDLMERVLCTARAAGIPEVSRSMLNSVELRAYRTRELLDLQRAYASSFGSGVSEDLMSAVQLLHVPYALARRMTAAKLRELLPEHIRGVTAEASDGLRDRLLHRRTSFVASARARRHPALASIERPEAQELYFRIQTTADATLFLVHGPAGSGKSDTLARVAEAWSDDDALLVVLDGGDGLPPPDQLRLALVRSIGGERRPVLLLDQLDQLALVPERLGPVERVLEEASRLGFTVVLGCRTVDARDGTYLKHLFARWRGRTEQAEIGELPEASVTEALSRAGLPWQRIPRPLQRIVRMPLGLRIVLELVERHGSLDATSFYGLVDTWIDSALGHPSAGSKALREVLACFERDGVVSELSLESDPASIAELVAAGLLHRLGRSELRFVHQVVADTLLARVLGKCASVPEVLARIGDRSAQGPREATRLRRAVVVFAARGANGAQMLDQLYRSDEVRPLVRHALLLGLADSSEPPAPALARVIEGWLREEARGRAVSSTLLWSRGAWVESCVGWIEAQWAMGDDDTRHHLLRLLASVAEQRGDMVARLLGAWRDSVHDTLERADFVFWQDPSKDSEALFELRLEAPARPGRTRLVRWNLLARAHPARAARLMVAMFQRLDRDTLVGRMHCGAAEPPSAEELGDALPDVAPDLSLRAREWWAALGHFELRDVRTDSSEGTNSILALVVDLLAWADAALLTSGQLSWELVLRALPVPRRPLDQWRLLELGGRLGDAPTQVVDDATSWLVSEPGLIGLEIGSSWWRRRYSEIASFVAAVGTQVSEGVFESLENWILQQRDAWSVELEAARMRSASTTRHFRPNDHGLIVYRLLSRLPSGRLSPVGRARLTEVRRKFEPVRETLLRDGPPLPSGYVAPRVNRDVVRGWSAEEWIRQLREIPEQGHGMQRGDAVVVHDHETATRQLADLCAMDPPKYFEVVRRIQDEVHRVRGFMLVRLVAAITTVRPPSMTDLEWRALSDDDAVVVVTHPRIVSDPSFEVDLGRIVRDRPGAPWPTSIVERLTSIARTPEPDDAAGARRGDVEHMVLNDGSCVAIGALIALAESRPELHGPLLDLAAELVEQGPSARRAVAAGLAFTCRNDGRERARMVVLDACEDPDVAGSYRVLRVLFQLHYEAEAEGARRALVDAMLRSNVAQDADTRRRGGEVAVVLYEQSIIDRTRLDTLLQRDATVRSGAARYVGAKLRAGEQPGLFRPLALSLADDPDDVVGDEIVSSVITEPTKQILTDRTFIEELLGTKAGQREIEDLLEALDEVGNLAPLTERILEVAGELASTQLDEADQREPWRRDRSIGALCARLARLADEVQSNGDLDLRSRVLDALDGLIEVDASAAHGSIELATAPDDPGSTG